MSSDAFIVREVPPHVPETLIFDFDIYSDPRLHGELNTAYAALQKDAPDIFFTPRNGGHWMMTRYADISAMMRAPEIFSSSETVVPAPPPEAKIPVPPLSMADPEHRKYRTLLNKFLGPTAIRSLEPAIRELCVDMIDKLVDKGHCDFVHELAVPFPVINFMTMMQWDTSNYRELVRWVHIFMSPSTMPERADTMKKLDTFLVDMIDARARTPGEDPLSKLLQSEVDGVRLSKVMVKDIGNLLFMAGLDTVTNAMAFIAHYFAVDQQLQARLRAAPEITSQLVDELMRRVAFVNTARVVTRNTEFGGIQFAKGDKVVGSLCAASVDPRAYECPMQVKLDRERTLPSLAFNTGPHNCAGIHLAKLELTIWLKEWLRRVPEFRLAEGFTPHHRWGQTMGLESLDLVWGAASG
jgi:cytochrome P450